MTTISIRDYRPGDEVQILDTFNRCFAAVDPAFGGRSMAVWRWRTLENPAGWRIRLAFDEEERLVAQYAGLPQLVRVGGGIVPASQSVDSLVDPTAARGIRAGKVFVRCGEAFARDYGGPVGKGDFWMWGYPIVRAWRVGDVGLGYEMVRQQVALVAEPTELSLPRASGVDVHEVGTFPDEVGAFFTAFCLRYGAVTHRTKDLLDWRYTRHPEHLYRIGIAREAGRLRGYAVYRKADFDGPDKGLICDWVAEKQARGALLAWLADQAREDAASCLYTWLPPWTPEFAAFQEYGFRVRPTQRFLSGRSFDRRWKPSWFRRNWYVVLGDTDLV